jgi:hypothetical protein
MTNHARTFVGLAIALSTGIVQPVEARERRNIVNVPSQFANCILRNKAVYEARATADQRRTISIYPTICPTTSPSPQQLADLTSNSGGEVNPDSTTILIPLPKSRCFFDRLGRSLRQHSGVSPVSVDISNCGQ